jgi:serine/threonine protein kinase
MGCAPPELCRNIKDEIGSRADLFALGVTLYECATGQHPFRYPPANDLDVLRRVESLRPVPLRFSFPARSGLLGSARCNDEKTPGPSSKIHKGSPGLDTEYMRARSGHLRWISTCTSECSSDGTNDASVSEREQNDGTTPPTRLGNDGALPCVTDLMERQHSDSKPQRLECGTTLAIGPDDQRNPR